MSVHGAGEVCKDTKESRECGHLGRNNLKPFSIPSFSCIFAVSKVEKKNGRLQTIYTVNNNSLK